MQKLLSTLVLIGWMPLAAPAAPQSRMCDPPDALRDAIAQAGAAKIKSLLEKHPKSFWIRRAFIDANVSGGTMGFLQPGSGMPRGRVEDSVIARFQKDYESRPADPEAAYLYAYSLIHKDTTQSVGILTSAVQKNPDFPPALLTLAILHGYPNWYDQEKMRQYAQEYLARCPDTTETGFASLAAQLDRSDALTAYTKALRARIGGKSDDVALSTYPALWQLESKTAQPAGMAASGKRLESDLQFLEALDKTKFPTATPLLLQGYERTGNMEGLRRIAEESNLPFALNPMAHTILFHRARSEWVRTNPPPSPAAPPEERTIYYNKQLQFLNEWREQLPRYPDLLIQRLEVLASLPDIADEALIREGGALLSVLRTQGGLMASSSGSSPFFRVLGIWAKRGLELDLIPSLVEEAMASQARMSAAPSAPMPSDLFGGAYQALSNDNRNWEIHTGAWAVLATTWIKKQQFTRARAILAEWEQALSARRNKAVEIREKQMRTASAPKRRGLDIISSMEAQIAAGISGDAARYYERCGQLAAAEGRSLDALTYYQTFLRLLYGRSASGIAEPEALDASDSLWRQLGGSQATWTLWLDSIKTVPTPATVQPPPAANRAIPKFSLKDQHGKTWTLKDLKGKTTLLNVWATWCAPCRQELPLLQQLYARIKNRADIQVITLNVDQDQSLVHPFLKTNKYSFPTLFASTFVAEFAGPIGIPTTWIADAAGTIRHETLGFSGNNAAWIAQTLGQIENIHMAAKQ